MQRPEGCCILSAVLTRCARD